MFGRSLNLLIYLLIYHGYVYSQKLINHFIIFSFSILILYNLIIAIIIFHYHIVF